MSLKSLKTTGLTPKYALMEHKLDKKSYFRNRSEKQKYNLFSMTWSWSHDHLQQYAWTGCPSITSQLETARDRQPLVAWHQKATGSKGNINQWRSRRVLTEPVVVHVRLTSNRQLLNCRPCESLTLEFVWQIIKCVVTHQTQSLHVQFFVIQKS